MSRVLVLKSTSPQATPELMREMFQLRRKVFKDRLKWDIRCTDDQDIDYFDCLGPVYGLYFGDDGRLEGSWRLLPTTGPYMIRDVFPVLLDGRPAPCDSQVWEVSRFSMLPVERDYDSLAANYRIASGLLMALLEFGLTAGHRQIVSASDVRFERVLKRTGAIAQRLGGVHRIGTVASVAGWIDVAHEHLARVAEFADEPVGNVLVAPDTIAAPEAPMREAAVA